MSPGGERHAAGVLGNALEEVAAHVRVVDARARSTTTRVPSARASAPIAAAARYRSFSRPFTAIRSR